MDKGGEDFAGFGGWREGDGGEDVYHHDGTVRHRQRGKTGWNDLKYMGFLAKACWGNEELQSSLDSHPSRK